MTRKIARRVDARVCAVIVLDALREDGSVVGGDGAALSLRLACHGVVVRRHVLVVACLHDHDQREVCHERREHEREHDHGVREALAERDAPEHTVRADDGRGVHDLGGRAGALVAAAQEESDNNERGEQRRAALADEGERDAGKGDEPGDAADDDERLEHDDRGEARADKRAHVGFRARCGHEAANREAQVQKQQACRTQKPCLLADGREDEVAFHDRDAGDAVAAACHAAPDSRAEQVAVGKRIDGLHELIAGVLCVGEGIKPGSDTRLHVVEGEVGAHAADGNEAQADDQVELLSCGNVEHDQEHEEEHERAAEILLEHDDEHCHAPHEEQRQERADVGQAERAYMPSEHREHLAVLRKVAGQEEHDNDLRDLAWLEGESAYMQPDAAAVDFLADAGDHRREQKNDADDGERVLVVGEPVGIAQKRHDRDHEHDAQEQPNDLVDGHILAVGEGRYARDEGDADA